MAILIPAAFAVCIISGIGALLTIPRAAVFFRIAAGIQGAGGLIGLLMIAANRSSGGLLLGTLITSAGLIGVSKIRGEKTSKNDLE